MVPFHLDWQATGGPGPAKAQGQVHGGAGNRRDPGRMRRGSPGTGPGHSRCSTQVQADDGHPWRELACGLNGGLLVCKIQINCSMK